MANRRTLLPTVFFLLSWIIDNADSTRMRTLPKEFYFGVSTASYQVEGAWNATGKGESIWDHLVHTLPSSVKDRSNADQACDSYRLYETDVAMLDRLGVDFYRFSISWSRLLPTGFMDQVSPDGVDFYNRLIDSLIERDIVPMVVLHHWDLPQPLQVLGGWPNALLADYFADFARTAFSLFGDRVRLWATFSQPDLMCRRGYGGHALAPMLNASGLAEYMCAHTVLLAHAKVYHIYDKEYRKKNGGMIGIILHSYWSEPASKSYEDQRAAEQSFMFNFAWMAQPIFSSGGNYPKAMTKRIAARSSRQKFQRSRFPSFQDSEVRSLAGSADFLGLCHATTRMVRAAPTSFVVPENPSFEDDRGVDEFDFDRSRAPAVKWLKVSSKGFRKVLNFIRKEYRDPEVIVMGDGLESSGGLHDPERIAHMNLYLSTIADAIEDGCNIKAFSAWSLMDGFNWLDGYTKKYGLYEVDFRSANRTRTLRDSGKAYADIIKARSFVSSDICSGCDEDREDLFDEYNSVENK